MADTAHSRQAREPKIIARVRVSPGYFIVAALATFASLVLLRTHRDLAALVLVLLTWVVTPVLMITDRLSFDGSRLFRTGVLPFLSRVFRGRGTQLIVDNIERVDVSTLRTLRRGGSVRYRYRIEISGDGQAFVFASGGYKFRRLVKLLLSSMPEQKLDARACELRDYLCEPKELNKLVNELGVANLSLLEQTAEAADVRIERRLNSELASTANETARAELLRKAGNHLRVAGRLREAAEAFRRALHISGSNACMIYEYARLMRSQAAAFGDADLLARASAALRLAQIRASRDARLLERIGESFLEFGQPRRAAKAFRFALESDNPSYRAQVGLAEIALSEGKLAHVIHHYREADRLAPDRASARFAQREADYYALLNDDDDYLSAELRRMNWLEAAGRVQQLAARASFGALLIALVGPYLSPAVASVGWALASSSIIGWSGALVLKRFLSRRRRGADQAA